jgi:hypothetical protein
MRSTRVVRKKKLRRKSKLGLKKGSGHWRPTKRQVFWAIGVVVTLMTIALLVVQLYPGLWEDLSREWGTCGDALRPVTYIQAWERWASGSRDNVCLETWKLKLSLLWWGRIGKSVTFVASLFVVADIIGYERIKDFGDRLRTDVRSKFTSLAETLRELKGPLIGLLTVLLIAVYIGFYVYRKGWDALGRAYVCGSESGAISSACSRQEQWDFFWQFVPFYIGSWMVAVAAVLLVYFILAIIIPKLLIEPLAGLLRILPRWVKVLNLLLIVVGFHFDLLAS